MKEFVRPTTFKLRQLFHRTKLTASPDTAAAAAAVNLQEVFNADQTALFWEFICQTNLTYPKV